VTYVSAENLLCYGLVARVWPNREVTTRTCLASCSKAELLEQGQTKEDFRDGGSTRRSQIRAGVIYRCHVNGSKSCKKANKERKEKENLTNPI
jgi:hypothetical protein